MARLEEITKGARVNGIVPGQSVAVVDVRWHGDAVIEVYYKETGGRTGSELLYRDQEAEVSIAAAGTLWSFTGDGDRFRLVFEALRIRLAHLFDPMMAVHSSQVIPLPHQITAVYQEMLTRQPLRFLLADDPGAGKTVMAGLLIRELIARGDVARCIIVCPGALVEQWQDELSRKFNLPFQIMTNDHLAAARTGNWFQENHLVICRLDKLSRNPELQDRLRACDWDLCVVDEAHKLSASYFGGEVKYTQRYRLGQLLSEISRHFLLMTATPHNGKESDFQLFMALLDGDRFEGKFRDGVHQADVSDLMRRLVKEKLVKFDGTPLFPERIAYTVPYKLSEGEARLYAEVTNYVTEEFNRADALESGKSKGNVGFALTALQRRLASSPEAIYQSLRRRRARLEKRLREEQIVKRGMDAQTDARIDLADVEGLDGGADFDDYEDAPDQERETAENRVIDEASAAQTIAELQAEIEILARLEHLAQAVRQSETDKKWEELSSLLQNKQEMFDQDGRRRKLVIFSEHRDTLNYLHERISNVLGRPEAVVTIHGGMGREERRKAQEAFTQDRDVVVLIATDAAGVGINLQRAHLMVNYDLPWNPNRLEQRFGRIHRIGQTEVCHLWNILFAAMRVALPSSELPDEREVCLYVLGPDRPHKQGNLAKPVSAAITEAGNLLKNRGSSLRSYQNMLVFLAPDQQRLPALEQSVRQFLAWQSIVAEADTLLDLTPYNKQQATTKVTESARVCDQQINEAYQWVLAPKQPPKGSPPDALDWQELRAQGSDSLAIRAAKKLKNEEDIITVLGGNMLRREIDNPDAPLWRGNHVAVKELEEYFARYLYLPRLKDMRVLHEAVRDGVQSTAWETEGFAYADGYDEVKGKYIGLKTGQVLDSFKPLNGLVVKPEVAIAALAAVEQEIPQEVVVAANGSDVSNGTPTTAVLPTQLVARPRPGGTAVATKKLTRFHGQVKLDPQQLATSVGKISAEVLQHLMSVLGSNPDITLEIQVTNDAGFSESTVRTVSENCRTLKFSQRDFEEE